MNVSYTNLLMLIDMSKCRAGLRMTRLQRIGNNEVFKSSFAWITQAFPVHETSLFQQRTLVFHTNSEGKEFLLKNKSHLNMVFVSSSTV
jgi:hypothetical protein